MHQACNELSWEFCYRNPGLRNALATLIAACLSRSSLSFFHWTSVGLKEGENIMDITTSQCYSVLGLRTLNFQSSIA